MKKIINEVLKYLFMSIVYGVLTGILKYRTKIVVDINQLIISSFILFIFLCILALIAPYVRKLLGYKNKE